MALSSFLDILKNGWKFAANGQKSTAWNDEDLRLGWAKVGVTPPARSEFNMLQYLTDEKIQWVFDQVAYAADQRGIDLAEGDTTVIDRLLATVTGTSAITKTYKGPALLKTAAGAVSVRAGTSFSIGSVKITVAENAPVTMPTLTTGRDYSVWALPAGTFVAVEDSFWSPAAGPANGVKIGGFHYGAVAPGTTLASGGFNVTPGKASDDFVWTQSALDLIVGINAHSMWDLQWRPKCDPRGMSCITAENGDPLLWADIYFCSPSHLNDGTSKYGSAVASGTVLPQRAAKRGGGNYALLSWFVASEIAFDHGKRLLSYEEFAEMAYGVTEAQSLGGAESTIPATGRTAGYTSRFGIEQATGHHWCYGNVAHGTGGTAWVSGAQRGQTYGTPIRAIFGGDRDDAAYSGSRCSTWLGSAWDSYWGLGLRAACDPLPLLA